METLIVPENIWSWKKFSAQTKKFTCRIAVQSNRFILENKCSRKKESSYKVHLYCNITTYILQLKIRLKDKVKI